MKLKRITALLLVLALCAAMCGCGEQLTEDKIKIAVIAKATASDFWHNVFSGVNSAATEYNVDVTIEGPESEEDYVTQNAMIACAVENGADAIVFSAIDYYNSVSAVEAAVNAEVKVVIIDSPVNSDKVSLVIGTDNYAAGQMAAQAALSLGRRHPEQMLYVGIVNYDVNSANGQERELGFRFEIGQSPNVQIVETINVASTTEDATAGALELMERWSEINVLVGFNEWMTLGVGRAIEQRKVSDTVAGIGFDSNVVSIGMLETGEMDALIVQNPFAMGYLGVEKAYNLVAGKSAPAAISSAKSPGALDITTVTTTITKENMFDDSSQKTLFQFS